MMPRVCAVCVSVICNVCCMDRCLLMCCPCLCMLGELTWRLAHILYSMAGGRGLCFCSPVVYLQHDSWGICCTGSKRSILCVYAVFWVSVSTVIHWTCAVPLSERVYVCVCDRVSLLSISPLYTAILWISPGVRYLHTVKYAYCIRVLSFSLLSWVRRLCCAYLPAMGCIHNVILHDMWFTNKRSLFTCGVWVR